MTLQAVVCCICEENEGNNIYEENGQEYRFCDFCIEWFKVLKKANEKTAASLIIAKMKAEAKKLTSG